LEVLADAGFDAHSIMESQQDRRSYAELCARAFTFCFSYPYNGVFTPTEHSCSILAISGDNIINGIVSCELRHHGTDGCFIVRVGKYYQHDFSRVNRSERAEA